MKAIVIGDPHFKRDNIENVELFISKITVLIDNVKPDFIVMLGDLLHDHERLHTIPLNYAYDFIRILSGYPTFCIVGNHDLINNQQFLTTNHWMNAMKEWDNVTVVDKVVAWDNFLFVPYVPPGRFHEAIKDYDLDDYSAVFCHQEFYGCKMGAIISEHGDQWDDNNPLVIAGHIHQRQYVGKNVFYPGSAMQHAFGESEFNIILEIEFEMKEYKMKEYNLEMPRKRIVNVDIKNVETLELPESKPDKLSDQIRYNIHSTNEEYKCFQKTKKYKELVNKGAKIVFREKKIVLQGEEQPPMSEDDFKDIFLRLVKQENDPEMEKELLEFL